MTDDDQAPPAPPSAADRDENGRFLAGASGNPKGRPAVVREVRSWCQEYMTDEGWGKVVEIIRDPATKAEAALTALRLIAEYGYGKPSQKLEVDSGLRDINVNLVPPGTLPPADA